MQQISEAILTIYRSSKNTTQTQFLAQAFHTVREYVPFGRLCWRAGITGDAGLVVCSLVSLASPCMSIEDDRQAAREGLLPILLPQVKGLPDPIIDDLCEFKHRSHTIAVWHRFAEPETHTYPADLLFSKLSFLVLSLHRSKDEHAFTENEREIVQTLHTHISEAWSMNSHDTLRRLLYDRNDDVQAGAITTADGTFLFSSERFVRDLINRWPRPVDARLPEPLRQALISGKSIHDDSAHRYLITTEGPIAYISMHPRRAVDSLTARELQVAQKVASGLTHKEIARAFGVSPNTVRKQIVSIHARMGVRNNAELAAQLSRGMQQSSPSAGVRV